MGGRGKPRVWIGFLAVQEQVGHFSQSELQPEFRDFQKVRFVEALRQKSGEFLLGDRASGHGVRNVPWRRQRHESCAT